VSTLFTPFLNNKTAFRQKSKNAVTYTLHFVQALASQGDEITLNHTLFFRYDLLTSS
jgi:hypothetical protein